MAPHGRLEITLTEHETSALLAWLAARGNAPEAEPAETKPITTWRAAAAAIGVSDDTLLRVRRAAGVDATKPTYADVDEALRDYERMRASATAPAPLPARPARAPITLAKLRATVRRATHKEHA